MSEAAVSPTEWVPLREAVLRLGVSDDTIRRRIKAGAIPAECRQDGGRSLWYVEVPVLAPDPVVEAVAGELEEALRLRERVAGLEGLVAAHRRAAEEARAERDAWRERAVREETALAEMRVLLRQSQEQAERLALALPSGERDASAAPTQAEPAAERGEEPKTQGGQSWWVRLAHRLRGG